MIDELDSFMKADVDVSFFAVIAAVLKTSLIDSVATYVSGRQSQWMMNFQYFLQRCPDLDWLHFGCCSIVTTMLVQTKVQF